MFIAQILGNIGRDAEVKNINGKEYLSFSVASTEKQGENETTTWVSVLASHNPNLLQFLKRGQQVFVMGRLSAKIYQSNNSFGIDLSVFAKTLQLCGGKREEQTTTPAASAPVQPPTPVRSIIEPQQPFTPAEEEQKDDLPF